MPLSEYEQRVLDQLERDLGSDPGLARAQKAKRRGGALAFAVIGVIAGLVIMVVGAASQAVPLGIAGFAVMIGSGLWGVLSGTQPAKPASESASKAKRGAPKGGSRGQGSSKRPRQSLSERAAERIARRRERGEL